MQEQLRQNKLPVAVDFHYMNLDTDGTQPNVAVAAALRAIRASQPDLLISVDDESNKLVTSQLSPTSRPAVAYLAILETPATYGYSPNTRATGLEEQVPHEAIIDLLAKLKPSKPLRIAIIGVDSATGNAEMKRLLASDWQHHSIGPTKLVETNKQWQEFVLNDAKDADVLLVLDTDMLQAEEVGVLMPVSEIIQWTETNARALPIGIRENYVTHGGGLAISAPPSVYGKLAMQLALQWIDDGLESGVPAPIQVPYFYVSIRASATEKRGIELPLVYQELARSTGGLYP
ncbi:hypothetical protein [Orrella daihaiensis]|uniref:ABC transporter substrate-binding protein n=1 Tax=Orrella daihaiensis TaxID=2782176 RepID=A0ABY4AIG7_9BURK|nr:hypothetical protein [Orrella daihaiensis]UOD50086.1 hypothetical protein DHf2319_11690 [Orrella daihaiensis]